MKGVPPYDYMGDWKNFNETTLPKKEEFYSEYGRNYRCRLYAWKKSL